MSIRKFAIATIFAALAFSLDCAAADSYSVKAGLYHGGKRFAAPVVKVVAETPATTEVEGKDGYRLAIEVEELAPDRLKVSAGLVSPYGSISPVLVVRPGQPATVDVGDLGMVVTVDRNDD